MNGETIYKIKAYKKENKAVLEEKTDNIRYIIIAITITAIFVIVLFICAIRKKKKRTVGNRKHG